MSPRQPGGLPYVLSHIEQAQVRLSEIQATLDCDDHLSEDALIDACQMAFAELNSLLWLARWELQGTMQDASRCEQPVDLSRITPDGGRV